MEAEERPSKIRRLSSGQDEEITFLTEPPANPHPEPLTVPGGDLKTEVQIQKLGNEASPHSRRRNSSSASSGGRRSDTDNDNDLIPPVPPEPQTTNHHSDSAPLSKNAQKRLLRQQEWEAGRAERKLFRKQKEQERKARKRAAALDTSTTTTDRSLRSSLHPHRQPRATSTLLPITILLDCSFNDLMTPKELISLAAQITRSYSDNSRARFRAHLGLCSWGGELEERFETVLGGHYRNWKGVKVLKGDFVEAGREAGDWMRGEGGGRMEGVFKKLEKQEGKKEETEEGEKEQQGSQTSDTPFVAAAGPSDSPAPTTDLNGAATAHGPTDPSNSNNTAITWEQPTHPSPPSPPLNTPSGEIIYLTADSPHTLSSLHPNSTYIIGALVDKNRHKGICYQRARERGIRTAKLPIAQYLDMQSRQVLAVNHVVEIMLRWLEGGDWARAFWEVVPRRKGGVVRNGKEGVRKEGKDDDDDGEEDDGDDHGDERGDERDEEKDSMNASDKIHEPTTPEHDIPESRGKNRTRRKPRTRSG